MSGRRVATAPISWGVCEVPGWGVQLPPHVVLQQMQQLGVVATELGPDGWLPEDPARVRALLDEHGLQLVGGFVPALLHDPAALSAQLESVERQARRIALAGGEMLVLAATLGAGGYDERAALDAGQWHILLDGLQQAQQVADEAGLALAVHPHAGTAIERAEDVQRVLDGSSVGLCLDSGHLLVGGVDPVALAQAHGERVVHVHLKDVDARVLGSLRGGDAEYADAVAGGLYCELGTGILRVNELCAALEAASYGGWYVLERDVRLRTDEDTAPALAAVGRSLALLRHVEYATLRASESRQRGGHSGIGTQVVGATTGGRA